MRSQVVLVNAEDEVIGKAEKLGAHEQGLLHRAFSVQLYRYRDGEIEWLLQQRNANKYHTGGLWTNTCCSHPQPLEDTASAAHSRLKEETNIETELKLIGQFRYCAHFANGLIEHELDHVFLGEWQDLPTAFDRDEIAAMKWMRFKTLEKSLDDEPYLYTPWLPKVLGLAKQAVILK